MNIRKLSETIGMIKDPRRQWGNIRHKLEDILIIGFLSILSYGGTFEDMETFGKSREKWLRTFLELPSGIPDSDTFRRMFESVCPKELAKWLDSWLEHENKPGGRLVAVDGKTIRGSGNEEHKAYHVVSAWVGENGITLGEIEVGQKSNEIKAVPELLDMLDIKGDVVTADAMSCQKEIAAKIIAKKADYILALKGNQRTMEREAKEYFDDLPNNPQEAAKASSYAAPIEKCHGRIERRTVTVVPCDWFEDGKQWAGMRSFVRVARKTTIGSKVTIEERYYISSLAKTPEEFCSLIRGHWSIENNLHWCLDVIFGEDDSRARKDNSPLNLNVLRKKALSCLKTLDLGKRVSLNRKRYMAALDPDVLLRAICKF